MTSDEPPNKRESESEGCDSTATKQVPIGSIKMASKDPAATEEPHPRLVTESELRVLQVPK